MGAWRSLLITALACLALTTLLMLGGGSAAAEPVLVVASPSVSSAQAVSNTTYTLRVLLPPLTELHGERIACIRGAALLNATPSAGSVSLSEGCVFLTASNPSLKPLEVQVVLVAAEPPPQQPQPPVALVAAVVAAAAASYLSLTESGREKLFAALSIPASYYIARFEDVRRSEKRVRILQYLRENPGASMRRISRETGISFGEVQWHLSILERLGLVQRVRIGKRACYYPVDVPIEEWLPRFAAAELGAHLDAAALRAAKARLESMAARGAIPLSELEPILAAKHAKTG
uniref:Winged helix-turn-helix transcriptional regulator n=1 Tax=Thermofilum pendens TaxID=2269 RepID=A0A7J3X9F9_THEPE